MKLNKMKITRLTNKQARLIKGGVELVNEGASTKRAFTCGWCTGGDSFECSTVDFNNDPKCNTTKPYPA